MRQGFILLFREVSRKVPSVGAVMSIWVSRIGGQYETNRVKERQDVAAVIQSP